MQTFMIMGAGATRADAAGLERSGAGVAGLERGGVVAKVTRG